MAVLVSFVQQFPWMCFAKYLVYVTWPCFAKYLVYVTWPTILLKSLFHNLWRHMHDWQLCEIIMKSDFDPDLFISRDSNHRCNCSILWFSIALCINVARANLLSINLTTLSDTFEAISSKFVRTSRIPNSHAEVRRPISALGANYMSSLANSPINVWNFEMGVYFCDWRAHCYPWRVAAGLSRAVRARHFGT